MIRDDNISVEEFERRLVVSNERTRQQVEHLQARYERLAALASRKEALAAKLTRYLVEVEQEEAAIRAEERQLAVRTRPSRRAV
jgi:hypothetical protein